ncbi:hypothetical protein LTR56_019448 [Elasticomyces elasticus]|nr:hypothetical protein LTR56_019448 [Elasticomyces elasticus]KAK3634742.1 hypothetical protein LTR22_019503 [Elasticomyces elasticus]KAK5750815.1 hypothetical protein LTS12_019103 [Elasticomyces elasticus]
MATTMATASYLPSPGDGEYLVQQGIGFHHRGRRSFLKPNTVVTQPYNYIPQEGRSNLRTSFLRPHYSAATSLPICDNESIPRTISAEKPLLPSQLPALPQIFTEQQPAKLTHTFSELTQDTVESTPNEVIMAPGNSKKGFVPPHLKAKDSRVAISDRGIAPPQERTASVQDAKASCASATNKTSAEDIREKLSTLGVTVSVPQTAATSVPTGSNENAQAPVPRGRHGRGASAQRYAGALVDNQSQSRHAPSSNYRGRGRGGRQAPRGSKWPTSKEQAPPKPSRYDNGPMSVSGWSIDSAQADPGLGEDQKKRAPADAEGFKLADWSGDWAPAPLNWDSRPAFEDPSKVPHIEEWLKATNYAIPNKSMSEKILSTIDECAPREWIPSIIDNQNAKAFIKDMLASNEPAPDDPLDLQDFKPWWDLYRDPASFFLLAYAQPTISGVDPDETLQERLLRENDHGSGNYAENMKRTDKAKQEAAKEAKREQRRKAEKRAKALGGDDAAATFVGNRIKPGLNLYVRSARSDDVVQLRDIYNYYVEFTCLASETKRLKTEQMQARYDAVVGSGLPFLVACERGGKVPSRRRKKNAEEEDLILPDKVVGYLLTRDFHDKLSLYRFACEVEVYIDKAKYMKGIARCLLDKFLGLLDERYVERGGFDLQGQELEGMQIPRKMESIIVRVPYEKPERLEWTGRFLRSMDFEQVGDLPEIGHRDGKSVSLAMFIRKTGVDLGGASPKS